MTAVLKLDVRLPESTDMLSFMVDSPVAIIGRAPSCDVVIGTQTVSGRHAVLRLTGARWTVSDLGSRNGTAIEREGERIAVEAGAVVELVEADLLLLGAADAPARVSVSAGVTAFKPAASGHETQLARTPLADPRILGQRDLARLVGLALSAASLQELAQRFVEFVGSTLGTGVHVAVEMQGTDAVTTAGKPLLASLREHLASDALVVFATPGEQRYGVVAPFVADGAWLGGFAAWSDGVQEELFKRHQDVLNTATGIVALVVQSLKRRLQAEAEAEVLREHSQQQGALLVAPTGTSPTYLKALKLAQHLAPSTVPLLVVGETGTGKEVFARYIHHHSQRARRPFVALNCAAIPESLLESELFGHARGAFTGATADHDGVFTRAEGGTLLLDEVGEMPMAMQAKLLRVLETGDYMPVGGKRTLQADVRLISATHRSLDTLVAEGSFRSDLMYRLNAARVGLPPLRERQHDILLLAHHFLAEFAVRERKALPGFTPSAVWALLGHTFPGNIRELRNEVQRAAALTLDGSAVVAGAFSESIAPDDAPAPWEVTDDGIRTLKECVALAERHAVEGALARTGSNVSAAARELGLSRQGLYSLMTRLDIEKPS